MTLRELQALQAMPPCDCPACPCCVSVKDAHEICADCRAGRHFDFTLDSPERRVIGRRFGSVRQGRSER